MDRIDQGLFQQTSLQSQQHTIDIRGGAHFDLLEPGTVTFVLYAPFKPFVSLVGDFNHWNSRANIMVSDGRGLWWTTIAHPGATRYGFYVAVDESAHVWVGDPYAKEVHWDRTGPWAYLPDHPSTYQWNDAGWRTPAPRDLVIYELCVRDFTGHWELDYPHYGTFSELKEKLPYLSKLGVNAIELMPIHEFPGKSSWGYNPVFYFAPEQTYGSPDDFKSLVDACHRMGIAVILDVAFNHAWGDHPYYQFYPPMYGPHGEELPDLNPFFHHTPRDVNMWGGVDWDHFVPETTRYFQDVVRYWLHEYHIDGFRFDWVAGVDYDSRDPMNPGFNPYHGISAICWAARQAKPDCILIGEYWPLPGTHPDKSAAKLVAETEMDSCWNGHFHHTMEDVLNQRWEWEKRDIAGAIGGFSGQGFTTAAQVVNYTCSHDEVRPEHEIKFYSVSHISRPPGMTVQEMVLAKARLGLVTLMTAPGIPMLYAGQEFGEDTPRTIDFLPLRWSKLDWPLHRRHLQLVRRLVHLRHQHPALRSDNIWFYEDDFAATNLVRYHRWDDSGDLALVALNFGPAEQHTELNFPENGAWTEVIDQQRYTVTNHRLTFTLGAWQARIFVRAR